EHGLVRTIRIGITAPILPGIQNKEFEVGTITYMPIETMRIVCRRSDGPVLPQCLPPGRHLFVIRAGKIVPHVMIIPHHIDRRGFQESAQSLRTTLIAVTYPIGLQRGRFEVRTRFVRRRGTDVVAINRIPEKQKEVGMLSTDDVEDRIAADTLATALLTTKISAPDKRHRSRSL